MGWFGLGLSSDEKKRFEKFQKMRCSSMRVIGRGTLTMSLDDAHKVRKEMICAENSEPVSEKKYEKPDVAY